MRNIFFDRWGTLKLPWFMAVWLGGFAVLFAAIAIGLTYGVTRPTCFNKAEALEVEARWGMWAGCIVRVDGDARWFPLDQYRLEVDR